MKYACPTPKILQIGVLKRKRRFLSTSSISFIIIDIKLTHDTYCLVFPLTFAKEQNDLVLYYLQKGHNRGVFRQIESLGQWTRPTGKTSRILIFSRLVSPTMKKPFGSYPNGMKKTDLSIFNEDCKGCHTCRGNPHRGPAAV